MFTENTQASDNNGSHGDDRDEFDTNWLDNKAIPLRRLLGADHCEENRLIILHQETNLNFGKWGKYTKRVIIEEVSHGNGAVELSHGS